MVEQYGTYAAKAPSGMMEEVMDYATPGVDKHLSVLSESLDHDITKNKLVNELGIKNARDLALQYRDSPLQYRYVDT